MRNLCVAGAASLAVAVGLASGQDTGTAPPATPNPGLRFVHIGNSHSQTFRLLDPLAKAALHPKHQDDEISILGAPLWWNWDHPEQNRWKERLGPGKPWDAMLLLCWNTWTGNDRDLKDTAIAPMFAGEAYKANPQCQVLLYTIWPDANQDMEKPPEVRSEAWTEKVAEAVAKAHPHSPRPKVIPSSLLIREIGRLADRGEIPEMKTRFEVYTDGGHLSDIGRYAVLVMVCAMLYDESPLDYPDQIVRYDGAGKPLTGVFTSIFLSPETSRALRRVVWDILCTYPPAGMKPRLAIGDRWVPPAVVGQAYRHEMKALHAQGSPRWSLAKGKMPAGVSLSESGVIAGQSSEAGEHSLVVRVAAGNGTVERALRLEVAADKPPAVVTPALGKIGLDTYLLKELKAEGGVGRKSWSVAAGTLPHGLRLSPSGMLYGTPGEQGEFSVTVRVEDSHPAGSRSAESQMKLLVGPADPKTLLVKRVPFKAAELDAQLKEPFWVTDQPVSVRVNGAPVKKATFGAVWEEQERQRGKAQSLWLAVKVLDGPGGKSRKDGVHLYIDGRHNREVIYNVDDTHVFLSREERKPYGPIKRHVRGRPDWFIEAKALEIEGGYVMEIRIGSTYFIGEGNPIEFGARSVYGFDLAVEEDAGRQAWRGNERLDEDTSVFGTIVLTDTPAAGK